MRVRMELDPRDPETGVPISLQNYAIGREWHTLQPGTNSPTRFNRARAHFDRPCPTVTAAGGSRGPGAVMPPHECRQWTLVELRALCGFPPDYVLTGTYADRWTRLGNAVPPPMIQAVATTLRDRILQPKDTPMPPATKPPYRVPLVSETAAAPRNGLNVASTFAGGGGSSYGYELAGYTVLWANEVVPAARDTYRANHPNTILDGRDIREVQAADILTATGLGVGDLDLFDGSPPCQSFSTAGKREKGWGKVAAHADGTTQASDDLFFEYTRLLAGLRPRVFVAENVSGLVKGKAKGYFKLILAALQGCGYRVSARLLDAQWLGVPQARQRIIFVGVRDDLGMGPVHPSPLPYRYTVRDAIGGAGASMTMGAHGFFPGRVVQFDTEPAPAVAASGFGSYRYTIHRGSAVATLAITELRRLCGFPDDYTLTGGYGDQWARLGNSVPPPMMQHVAATIRDRILQPSSRTLSGTLSP